MAKVPSELRYTYEDYKCVTDVDTKRYELLDGDLLVTPAPSWKHQKITTMLVTFLSNYVYQHRLGDVAVAPVDVLIQEDVVQPDVLFISNERASIIHEDAVRGAPDLVVEVLSPSTAERDLGYKSKLYARNGVNEYWIVDPDADSVEVFTLSDGSFQSVAKYGKTDTMTSSLLSDLSIDLAQIF